MLHTRLFLLLAFGRATVDVSDEILNDDDNTMHCAYTGSCEQRLRESARLTCCVVTGLGRYKEIGASIIAYGHISATRARTLSPRQITDYDDQEDYNTRHLSGVQGFACVSSATGWARLTKHVRREINAQSGPSITCSCGIKYVYAKRSENKVQDA